MPRITRWEPVFCQYANTLFLWKPEKRLSRQTQTDRKLTKKTGSIICNVWWWAKCGFNKKKVFQPICSFCGQTWDNIHFFFKRRTYMQEDLRCRLCRAQLDVDGRCDVTSSRCGFPHYHHLFIDSSIFPPFFYHLMAVGRWSLSN